MRQVGHPAGLCNRLDVITTSYVLAKRQGEQEIEVCWPLNYHMPIEFHHLFTRLPSGRVVERDVDADMSQDYLAAAGSLPPNYRDSELYTEMLGRLLANAVPEVQCEVSAFAEENFAKTSGSAAAATIGVHVRRSEPSMPLCEFAQPLRYYEAAMKSFPRYTQFFMSTDSQEAFQWLHARFGNRVFQRPKMHNERSSIGGVQEGLIDLLLLSRCSGIVGTSRSSFSHIAALAGRRPLIRVKTFPQIPPAWTNFSRWRWIWAYRHFLRESTFWRVWLFYSVRPYAICVPNIPAHCLRLARKCASKRVN